MSAVVNVIEQESESEKEISVGEEIIPRERVKSLSKKIPKANGAAAIVVNGDKSNGSPSETHFKRFMKNSRKSRTRFGRGLAKKGGCGGKGTWGKIDEDYGDAAAGFLDTNDPNYDSDNLENCKLEVIRPVLEPKEIEKYVKPIIVEYFEHGNSLEVADQLVDFNFGFEGQVHIAVVAITLAMDRKNSYREMTSVLLSDLYGRVLRMEDFEHSYDKLLKNLPDLMLDTPTADEVLGNFIARSVADDCLPPIYVQRAKERFTTKPAVSAVKRAADLLATPHGLHNIDQIWGVAGGMRPVKVLIKKMQSILKEYLITNIVEDAGDSLKDLEVPHFHHEFVYETVVKAIEDSKETHIDSLCLLLKYLNESVIITNDQMKNGFLRVFEEMPDIVVDVPFAYDLLDTIKAKAEAMGFFPEELANEMPQRGRKRFVSEGDGGIIKA